MNKSQLNILLADDDPDDCLVFKEAIKELVPSENFTTVHDGEKLMHLLKNKIYKLPDVLFLDLNIPPTNGFECLAEIKQNKKFRNIPVVIFSTSFEQEVVNLLYYNGAKYFIRKPPGFKLFQKIILHTIKLMMQENISQPAIKDFVLTIEPGLITRDS